MLCIPVYFLLSFWHKGTHSFAADTLPQIALCKVKMTVCWYPLKLLGRAERIIQSPGWWWVGGGEGEGVHVNIGSIFVFVYFWLTCMVLLWREGHKLVSWLLTIVECKRSWQRPEKSSTSCHGNGIILMFLTFSILAVCKLRPQSYLNLPVVTTKLTTFLSVA